MLKCFLFVVFIGGIFTFDFLGPAILNVKRMEKCGEDLLGTKFNFFRHRINRTTQGTSMNFTLPFPLDDTIGINVSASIWGDGGWKPNAFDLYNDKMCSFMTTAMPELTKVFLKLLGQPEDCPLAAGTYEIENFSYNGSLKFPFIYGEFMFDISIRKDEVTFMCTRLFLSSDPIIPDSK